MKANTTIRREDETDTEAILELAKGLLTDFQKSTSLHVLNNVVSLVQQSRLVHLSAASTSRFMALTTLGDALYVRFNNCCDLNDLNEAISSLQDASKCVVERDQQKSNINFQICGLLATRFDLMGDISDLKMAMDWNIRGTETSTGILQSLELAKELCEQFTMSGNMADLKTAVTLFRAGIAELHQGSEQYAAVINNLANALWTQFEHGGQQSDLYEAISLHRQALELQLPPHPGQSDSLNNLATALGIQFEKGGQQRDLDETISLHRQSLELQLPPHPGRSDSLNNLATALLTQFKQGGQHGDLDEAISLHRQALKLRPPPHPL